jgi:protease-4
MKDFFKFMFASMLGFLLTSVILFFLFFAFIMAMVSFTQPEEVVVNDPSVLHLKLDYDIPDREESIPLQFSMSFEGFKTRPGLKELLQVIEKGKSDERIKGIYLDVNDMPSGLATLTELRNALLDFKASGKFIYAYGDIYFQKSYYLASAADKIFVNPEGFVELKGFSGNVMFIRGLLEKLDIEPQVIRHGKYKSAVEPLLLDEMSDQNREQTLAFIQSLWDDAADAMGEERGMTVEEINRIADDLLVQQTQNAHRHHVVDSLVYYDEFLSIMAADINVDHIKGKHLISASNYKNVQVPGAERQRSKNRIAVVYAAGDIVQGDGGQDAIGADKVARTIRQVRLDENIKALVLRVNSPGGDGLASDIILREMNLTKKEKPVVVSMGNLAASGGYYIACGADKIFASPTTITGSIGVFGLIPNFQGFFNNKMGITFDGVKTNKNAEFIRVTAPMSEFQRQVVQDEIDRFYTTFVNHVSEGRGLSYAEVDEIAQGRVWSGTDALKIQLVDALGGLENAIEAAAELAGLEDYRVEDYPKLKEPIQQIMEDLFGGMQTGTIRNELGEYYQYYRYIEYLKSATGVQARIPYYITIE